MHQLLLLAKSIAWCVDHPRVETSLPTFCCCDPARAAALRARLPCMEARRPGKRGRLGKRPTPITERIEGFLLDCANAFAPAPLDEALAGQGERLWQEGVHAALSGDPAVSAVPPGRVFHVEPETLHHANGLVWVAARQCCGAYSACEVQLLVGAVVTFPANGEFAHVALPRVERRSVAWRAAERRVVAPLRQSGAQPVVIL